MKKYTTLPALTGKQLIKLLRADGWCPGRHTRHGLSLVKKINDRTLVTFVPDTSDSLPEGTLQAIIATKQTRLGKKGVLGLINKYGLK